MDRERMHAGQVLSVSIENAIATHDYFVVAITPRSLQSDWVAREIACARQRLAEGKIKKIIPVIFEGAALPSTLNDHLGILWQSDNSQLSYDDLLRALDRLDYFDITTDTVHRLNFMCGVVTDESITMFGTTPSSTHEVVFENADGTKFPTLDLFLVRATTTGSFFKSRFASGRVSAACMKITQKHLLLFCNTKMANGTYANDGYLRYFNLADLRLMMVQPVFVRENWGAFPRFDENEGVNHLAYSGYTRVFNDRLGDKVQPSVMAEEHAAYIRTQSRGVLPGSSEQVAQAMKSYIDGHQLITNRNASFVT
jgi:TIR domain